MFGIEPDEIVKEPPKKQSGSKGEQMGTSLIY